jgi:hypothetical protein
MLDAGSAHTPEQGLRPEACGLEHGALTGRAILGYVGVCRVKSVLRPVRSLSGEIFVAV